MYYIKMPPVNQPDPEGTRTVDYPVAASATASLHYTGKGPGSTAMNWGSTQMQKRGDLGMVKTSDTQLTVSGLTVNSFYIITATWRGVSSLQALPNLSASLTSPKNVYGEPAGAGTINAYNTSAPGYGGGTYQYTICVKANSTSSVIITGNGQTGAAYIVDLLIMPFLI